MRQGPSRATVSVDLTDVYRDRNAAPRVITVIRSKLVEVQVRAQQRNEH